MKTSQRLSVLVLGVFLIIIIIVSISNPVPTVQLRLFSWKSVDLPLGFWLCITAGSTFLISGVAMLIAGPYFQMNPQKHNLFLRQTPLLSCAQDENMNREKPYLQKQNYDNKEEKVTFTVSNKIPERDPRDPKPTILTHFRVMRVKKNKNFSSN